MASDSDDTPTRRRGRESAIAAIVAAARELYRERTPGEVTMRELADRAGVNRGLVHHYFGTKEDLFAAVLRVTSEHAAESIGDADDLLAALRSLRDHPDGYAHMLGWMLINGMDADQHIGPSPTIAELTRLAADFEGDDASAGDRPFDPRLVVAVALTLSMGWQLYEPFMLRAAGLGDAPHEELRAEVGRIIDLMVRNALQQGDPAD